VEPGPPCRRWAAGAYFERCTRFRDKVGRAIGPASREIEEGTSGDIQLGAVSISRGPAPQLGPAIFGRGGNNGSDPLVSGRPCTHGGGLRGMHWGKDVRRRNQKPRFCAGRRTTEVVPAQGPGPEGAGEGSGGMDWNADPGRPAGGMVEQRGTASWWSVSATRPRRAATDGGCGADRRRPAGLLGTTGAGDRFPAGTAAQGAARGPGLRSALARPDGDLDRRCRLGGPATRRPAPVTAAASRSAYRRAG
jgi:hypothetical protein